jgi:hypothetical protein
MLHVVVCVEGGRGVEVDGASLTAGIEGLAETLLLFFFRVGVHREPMISTI